MLNERAVPTHMLRVEVPLNLDDPSHDYDAVKDAILLTLSVSRAAFSGHICDGPRVTMEEAT